MTKEEYFKFQDDYFNTIKELTKKKNADYAGPGTNPFKNFEHVGSYNPEWVIIGFFTRMSDKFARIASFAQKGTLEVKEESVTDTLMDLSNYACLLAGYIESKKKPPTNLKVNIQGREYETNGEVSSS
jgi:hypothetical protein